MKLVGIQSIEGTKDGRAYSFNVLHFLDNTPTKGLQGQRCLAMTPTAGVDLSDLVIGEDYQVFYYTGNNGRHYINGILD